MIKKIRVDNFKCFEHVELELSGLNLFSGINSMGKSTLVQALLLLRQSHEQGALEKGIYLNGKYVSLGIGKDILYSEAKEDKIQIEIEDEERRLHTAYEYNRAADFLKLKDQTGVDTVKDMNLFSDGFYYIAADRLGPQSSYEKGWDFRTEFQHEERVSKGCLLVYEMDGVAVSFLSDAHWKTAKIEGTYIELTDEGELYESLVKIPNVSFQGNIEKFKEFYARKKEEWRYTDIVSGEDILKYAQKAFPNLVFCESAVQGCKKNVGVSEAGQVYKRLLELQKAAERMEVNFDKNMLAKATPESGVTLERFEEEHTFRLPDGRVEIFSWHTRYTGGYAGRIFFYPAPEEKIIYVGHIGHKLPTVNYH